jgi:hypothetical protein
VADKLGNTFSSGLTDRNTSLAAAAPHFANAGSSLKLPPLPQLFSHQHHQNHSLSYSFLRFSSKRKCQHATVLLALHINNSSDCKITSSIAFRRAFHATSRSRSVMRVAFAPL